MRSMATEPREGPTRREVLAWLAARSRRPSRRGAKPATGPLYLSARNDAAGQSLREWLRRDRARPVRSALSGRGHAFAVHPRRPESRSLLAPPGAHGPGHRPRPRDASSPRSRPPPAGTSAVTGSITGDGGLLCATEEVGDEGRGLVGRYDPDRGLSARRGVAEPRGRSSRGDRARRRADPGGRQRRHRDARGRAGRQAGP